MRAKIAEREQAIVLRKAGFCYAEIQAQVPVSKATLSLWLRNIPLSPQQAAVLAARRPRGCTRAGETNRARRILEVGRLTDSARQEADEYFHKGHSLWLVGTALYWAEGTKPKQWSRGQRVQFMNMDPAMLLTFRNWLIRCCGVFPQDIIYSLYIHPSGDLVAAQSFWLKTLDIPFEALRVYFKQPNSSPRRHNTGRNYHGTIRVSVRRSTDLNHRIRAWIEVVGDRCGVG